MSHRIRMYILFFLLCLFLVIRIYPHLAEESSVKVLQAKKITEKLSTETVVKIEKKITKLEKKNKKTNKKNPFIDCIILGDSITGGFSEYEILDTSSVIYERGINLAHTDTLLKKAINLNPKYLFLALGMNDLDYYRGNTNKFKKAYEKVLHTLKKKLPDTEIYVNLILPIKKSTVKKDTYFKKVSAYNATIKKLCKKNHITVINNSKYIKKDLYLDDGIHVKKSYYPKWLDHMMEVADL